MQEMTPVLFTGLKCVDCLATFDIVSCGSSPPGICKDCTMRRISEIFAGECGHHVLPVPGDRVTCGMRKPPRQHEWVSLGTDVRHFDDGFLMEARVFVCMECGRDRMKRLTPKPKPPRTPPMDPEIKARRDELRRRLFAQQIIGKARAQILAEFDRQHN